MEATAGLGYESLSVRFSRFMIGVKKSVMILILSKEKDAPKMRRLRIESFIYAQTSMEIFGSELVWFLCKRTDVRYLDIKLSAQPV